MDSKFDSFEHNDDDVIEEKRRVVGINTKVANSSTHAAMVKVCVYLYMEQFSLPLKTLLALSFYCVYLLEKELSPIIIILSLSYDYHLTGNL